MTWLILSATLPTSPSGLRVRIWRALRATGCATLRDGVHLLPSSAGSAHAFRALEAAIRDGGADVHLLELEARDAAQEATFRAMFDRSDRYAELAGSLKASRKAVPEAAEPALRKLLRGFDRQLLALREVDFFAGRSLAGAEAALASLRSTIDRRFSPGEPASNAGAVERLDRADFQRRTWATRKRPRVDRLATAWLLHRFVDAEPRFLWLGERGRCPTSALGFDFDGARFTHRGGRVTFEVVAASFGLGGDLALARLGELVRSVDVGGIEVDEAAGIDAVVRGLHARHADDDGLLAAALPLFDALHAAFEAGA